MVKFTKEEWWNTLCQAYVWCGYDEGEEDEVVKTIFLEETYYRWDRPWRVWKWGSGGGSQTFAHGVPLASAFASSPHIFQAMSGAIFLNCLSSHDVQEISYFSAAPGISGEQRAVYSKTVWPHLCTAVRRGACSRKHRSLLVPVILL